MVGERNERGFWGIDRCFISRSGYSDIGFIISLYSYILCTLIYAFSSQFKENNIIYNIYGSLVQMFMDQVLLLLNMHLTNLLVFLKWIQMDTEFLTWKVALGTLALSWYSRGRCDLIITLISWFSVREEIMVSLSFKRFFEKTNISSLVMPEWLLPESAFFGNVTHFFNLFCFIFQKS